MTVLEKIAFSLGEKRGDCGVKVASKGVLKSIPEWQGPVQTLLSSGCCTRRLQDTELAGPTI